MGTADDLEKWVVMHAVFAAAVTEAMHCIDFQASVLLLSAVLLYASMVLTV